MLEKLQNGIKRIPKSILIVGAITVTLWIIGLIIAIIFETYLFLVYILLISTVPMISVLIYEIRKTNIRTREERKQQIQAEYQEQLIQMKHGGKQRSLEEIRGNFSTNNLARIDSLKIERKARKKYSCTISRIQILDGQEILQCPQCKNYFSEFNLLIWLERKRNCPVCRAKLLQ